MRALQLSLVNLNSQFYGYGWEYHLLELTEERDFGTLISAFFVPVFSFSEFISLLKIHGFEISLTRQPSRIASRKHLAVDLSLLSSVTFGALKDGQILV